MEKNPNILAEFTNCKHCTTKQTIKNNEIFKFIFHFNVLGKNFSELNKSTRKRQQETRQIFNQSLIVLLKTRHYIFYALTTRVWFELWLIIIIPTDWCWSNELKFYNCTLNHYVEIIECRFNLLMLENERLDKIIEDMVLSVDYTKMSTHSSILKKAYSSIEPMCWR